MLDCFDAIGTRRRVCAAPGSAGAAVLAHVEWPSHGCIHLNEWQNLLRRMLKRQEASRADGKSLPSAAH